MSKDQWFSRGARIRQTKLTGFISVRKGGVSFLCSRVPPVSNRLFLPLLGTAFAHRRTTLSPLPGRTLSYPPPLLHPEITPSQPRLTRHLAPGPCPHLRLFPCPPGSTKICLPLYPCPQVCPTPPKLLRACHLLRKAQPLWGASPIHRPNASCSPGATGGNISVGPSAGFAVTVGRVSPGPYQRVSTPSNWMPI